MAAIDKLYCTDYYNYRNFKIWCITYYPKLLLYFYDIDLTYSDFIKKREEYIDDQINITEKWYKKLGDFNNIEEAKKNYYNHYLEQGYNCPSKQLEEEVNQVLEEIEYTRDDWEDKFSFAIMNCPFKIDMILKWRCPIPFVRKYLYEQCGVKKRTNWLYKLFFKGTKDFV